MRIGILGGTFDPPHVAHLHAGEVAYRQLDLDVVLFIPAGAPWQKADAEVSAPRHRWEMTRLAVTGVDYFGADDREVHRDGWTFTADTVNTFDENDELVLILGADAAARLPTWERVDEVLSRVELAIAPRPGTDVSAIADAVGDVDFHRLAMSDLDISGTELRHLVAEGRSPRFLVTDAVWRYISEHRLYQQ